MLVLSDAYKQGQKGNKLAVFGGRKFDNSGRQCTQFGYHGGWSMLREKIGMLFVGAGLIIVSTGMAQLRAPGVPADKIADASILMKVAGYPYEFNGKAECTYASVASIFGTRAQRWIMEQSGPFGSVFLTFWRPADGSGDMFSFNANIGGKFYLVNTVNKGGVAVEGSGKISYTPSGTGGAFAIDAKTRKGETITGTIKCSAFKPATAEGG